MEISSPPPSTTYTVIDLDVGFLSGDVRQFTLFSTDTIVETQHEIELRTYSRDQHMKVIPDLAPEEITLYKIGLAWKSKRSRTFTYTIEPDADDTKEVIA